MEDLLLRDVDLSKHKRPKNEGDINKQVDNVRKRSKERAGEPTSPVNLLMDKKLYKQMKTEIIKREVSMREFIEQAVKAKLGFS